jgi:hypothetical protein
VVLYLSLLGVAGWTYATAYVCALQMVLAMCGRANNCSQSKECFFKSQVPMQAHHPSTTRHSFMFLPLASHVSDHANTRSKICTSVTGMVLCSRACSCCCCCCCCRGGGYACFN